ncbi:MAG: phosphatidylglycerophosphatase A [Deltaproteobacteria bacterium]|nr:phosphatidylglycerophosphatase A [Deltaproteobacteria bacterium]
MAIYKFFIDLFATGFYAGKSPISPGTIGTAFAAIIAFFFPLQSMLSSYYYGSILTLFFALFSIWIANESLRLGIYGAKKEDPQQIVIDEFAGYFVALIGLPLGFQSIAIAFVLFRIFDISKLYPVNKFEFFPRGYGIVLDDIMAGIYANIFGQLIIYLWLAPK